MSSNNHINSQLLNDYQEIVEDACIDWTTFRNKSFFITGANGFIASALIKFLLFLSHTLDLNIHIIALFNNYEKGIKIYGEEVLKELEVIKQDVRETITYNSKIDYIFHFASITSSKTMISLPVDTIEVSVFGTSNVLQLAVKNSIESMVYISSMEVYGTFDDDSIVTEGMLGYIDNLKIRSNYPESKRLCENMSASYYKQYKVPVKIARLSQTFGAGVLSGDNRLFIQIAKSIIDSKPIVLHTEGKSEGNYCYISDCIRAILLLLVKGNNGEAYNIVNEDSHTTIRDMANLISRELGNGKSEVVFDIMDSNVTGYAQDTKLYLSSVKMRSLGWSPKVSLVDSYKRMINYIKEENM